MSKTPKVAVVILNWNGVNHLREFLPSVMASVWPNLDVIIGDNASTDNSVDFIKNSYPSIKIIENDQNYGFTGGYNRVLENVEADYFILLNSDVEVFPGWIAPVIELMESDPLIAVAAPKIMAYLQKDYFEHAGAAGGFIDKFGYPFCQGRMFYEIEKDLGQYEQSHEVFWASGAAMFIKKHCWVEAGGFDEEFFAHMEEIDLCWRLKNKGYKVMYCARSEVFHLGGGTLNAENPFKTYLNFRNNLLLLKKNLSFWRGFLIISIRLWLDLMAVFRFLSEGKRKDAWAVSRAHQYLFLSFFRGRVGKSEVRSQKSEVGSHTSEGGGSTANRQLQTANSLKGMYKRSIVWEFFLKKKKHFTDLDPADFL
jgi:GT2 family glycosyltransferase